VLGASALGEMVVHGQEEARAPSLAERLRLVCTRRRVLTTLGLLTFFVVVAVLLKMSFAPRLRRK
jgi:hypothetical protein